MNHSNITTADMEKCLQALFKAEMVFRHFIRKETYDLEQTELMYIAQTLADEGKEQVLNVCGWLEEMQAQAKKTEARK